MNNENEHQHISILKERWNKLTEGEQRVIKHALDRATARFRSGKKLEDDRSFGERLSDRLSTFGGSWTFIIVFVSVLISWILVNGFVLVRTDSSFDPFPFILLNLVLSMLAALQAPVILMSQNRQAARDRLQSTHDYEIDLKAELEILGLHHKLDELIAEKWDGLMAVQQEQVRLLQQLLGAARGGK